jgi:hypothetical protein
VVNGLLSGVLSLESHLLARRWPLPLGTSLLAVARRDDGGDPGAKDGRSKDGGAKGPA